MYDDLLGHPSDITAGTLNDTQALDLTTTKIGDVADDAAGTQVAVGKVIKSFTLFAPDGADASTLTFCGLHLHPFFDDHPECSGYEHDAAILSRYGLYPPISAKDLPYTRTIESCVNWCALNSNCDAITFDTGGNKMCYPYTFHPTDADSVALRQYVRFGLAGKQSFLLTSACRAQRLTVSHLYPNATTAETTTTTPTTTPVEEGAQPGLLNRLLLSDPEAVSDPEAADIPENAGTILAHTEARKPLLYRSDLATASRDHNDATATEKHWAIIQPASHFGGSSVTVAWWRVTFAGGPQYVAFFVIWAATAFSVGSNAIGSARYVVDDFNVFPHPVSVPGIASSDLDASPHTRTLPAVVSSEGNGTTVELKRKVTTFTLFRAEPTDSDRRLMFMGIHFHPGPTFEPGTINSLLFENATQSSHNVDPWNGFAYRPLAYQSFDVYYHGSRSWPAFCSLTDTSSGSSRAWWRVAFKEDFSGSRYVDNFLIWAAVNATERLSNASVVFDDAEGGPSNSRTDAEIEAATGFKLPEAISTTNMGTKVEVHREFRSMTIYQPVGADALSMCGIHFFPGRPTTSSTTTTAVPLCDALCDDAVTSLEATAAARNYSSNDVIFRREKLYLGRNAWDDPIHEHIRRANSSLANVTYFGVTDSNRDALLAFEDDQGYSHSLPLTAQPRVLELTLDWNDQFWGYHKGAVRIQLLRPTSVGPPLETEAIAERWIQPVPGRRSRQRFSLLAGSSDELKDSVPAEDGSGEAVHSAVENGLVRETYFTLKDEKIVLHARRGDVYRLFFRLGSGPGQRLDLHEVIVEPVYTLTSRRRRILTEEEDGPQEDHAFEEQSGRNMMLAKEEEAAGGEKAVQERTKPQRRAREL
eukprot:GSA25T00027445001.1